MDIASSYSTGSAITDLRNANKAEAETKFNEMIDTINTQASDEDTLFGGIQKAGASIVGVGALGKGVISNFQKLKAKLSGKNSKKEGGDEDAEDGDGEGVEMDTYQIAPRQPRQIEGEGEAEEGEAEAPTESQGLFDEGNEADTMGQVNFGDEGLDPIADAAGDLDAPLFEEDITGEEGGEFEGVEGAGEVEADFNQTISTAQTAGGVLDPTGAEVEVPTESTFEAVGEEGLDLGADATADAAASGLDAVGSTLGSIVSSATEAVGNAATSVGSAVSSAIDATTSAVSGAVDATTGAVSGATDAAATAAATGAEVAGDVAGSAGLEAAGAALDATGVGAPIGLILNIIGGLVLGGTMAAGIAGEVDASNTQQSATANAQNQLKQATTGGLSNIAGKYAV